MTSTDQRLRDYLKTKAPLQKAVQLSNYSRIRKNTVENRAGSVPQTVFEDGNFARQSGAVLGGYFLILSFQGSN